jgi:hypothetical protein
MPNDPRPVEVITIQSDENYYNTSYQAQKKKIRYFSDNFEPSRVGNTAFGFFQIKSTYDNNVVNNSKSYTTSSTTVDDSGNLRKILSPNVDYFSSSSIDSYRNGIEISKDSHWTAGLAKISAGTPGHLYEKNYYGINDLDIVSEDIYFEISTFNPVDYVSMGSGSFIYPIITSDSNQAENYLLNGIIEPFPIRPVISNFSINFPFEPQGTRGQFGQGNINWRGSTDLVVNTSIYSPERKNECFFLDASDIRKLSSEDGDVAPVGPPDGFLNTNENIEFPFEDKILPRGEPAGSSYDSILVNSIQGMTGSADGYLRTKEKSSTAGFVCEYSEKGTDSITFNNFSWNVKNRDNRRHRRSIISLRDSEPFIKADTKFNDGSIIFFNESLNTVEYPIMIPLEITSSIGLDSTVKSEIFREKGIRVTSTKFVKSGLYETPLSDSILSVKKRMGLL